MSQLTLDIQDLRLSFKSYQGLTPVLHGLTLNIAKGERVALVGESGSGKSVTARIILGLLQSLKSAQISGDIQFEEKNLANLSAKNRHALRGTKMSMIFQDPSSALNPVYTIKTQFTEVLRRRQAQLSQAKTKQLAIDALIQVAIDSPERVLDSYPFQLSGGMNQRVMIAMALVNNPALLIADEPGTALDVTVQAQTLNLMHKLVEEYGTSVLFISHNLGVVRDFADRVYVIYKGRIVEQGPTRALFNNPQHAYTKALIAAVPRITGGGIPNIADVSESYDAPAYIHGLSGDEL